MNAGCPWRTSRPGGPRGWPHLPTRPPPAPNLQHGQIQLPGTLRGQQRAARGRGRGRRAKRRAAGASPMASGVPPRAAPRQNSWVVGPHADQAHPPHHPGIQCTHLYKKSFERRLIVRERMETSLPSCKAVMIASAGLCVTYTCV